MKPEVALYTANRSNAAIVLPEIGMVYVEGDQAILPLSEVRKISKESWLHAVMWASKAIVQVQFFLGDLIHKGIEQFGREETIREVMKVTRLPRKTVVDYERIANKVSAEVRRPELDFSFHRVVAPLDHAWQEYFLNLAVEREWSVEDFKFAVAMRTDSPAAATTNGSQRFWIRLSGDDAFILQTLAAKVGVDPIDLIQQIVRDYLEEQSPLVDDVHTIIAIEHAPPKTQRPKICRICQMDITNDPHHLWAYHGATSYKKYFAEHPEEPKKPAETKSK